MATALQQNFNEFVRALMHSSPLPTEAGERGRARPFADPGPMNAFFRSVDWDELEVGFKAVDERELRDFLAGQRKAGATFDVTACKNTALAGAVAWLVSRGGSPIHVLEVSKQRKFDERDLLPYLEADDYAYPALSSSPLIRGAVRRVNAGTLHKKTFWAMTIGIAILVAMLTYLLPPELETPLFAAVASIATIMSAVAIWVRDSP